MSVSSLLQEKGVSIIFNVTLGDYSKGTEGERRNEESYNNGKGWNPILVAIKKMVEEEK